MNNDKINGVKFDVAVVGGGPAGMMAAGRAAQLGAKTVLLEKNKKFGRKLLLTGGGRCNLTQKESNLRIFCEKFGRQGMFLMSPLSVFGIEETMNFFENRGLKLKIENGNRVFPKSDSAIEVLDLLLNFIKKGNVKTITNAEIISFEKEDGEIKSLLLKDGKRILADNFIIATGGKSYPKTGSSGEGFVWVEAFGHNVTELKPALSPIKIKEKWPKEAQGVSLENVGLSVFQKKEKYDSRVGECVFTHFGIGGPIVLDISRKVNDLLEKGKVKIFMDLRPDIDFEELDKNFQDYFRENQNKMFKNAINELFPEKLAAVIIRLSSIGPESLCGFTSKEERRNFVKILKGLEMTVAEVMDFNKAMVTNGGISLDEIDSKTMKSKLVKNLFFAGEIIDLDGPCGGYNLQLCWTTGYVAGENAAKNEIKS